jgi:hypothetical protein
MFQAALEELFEFGDAAELRVDERRTKFMELRAKTWQAAAAESLPYPAALGVVFHTGNLIQPKYTRCVELETGMISAYAAACKGSGGDVVQADAEDGVAMILWLLRRFVKNCPSSAPEGVSQALIDAVAEQQNAPTDTRAVPVDSLTTEQLIAAAFDTDEDSCPRPQLELAGRPDCAPAVMLAAVYLLVVWCPPGICLAPSAAELAKLVADKFRGMPANLALPPVIV